MLSARIAFIFGRIESALSVILAPFRVFLNNRRLIANKRVIFYEAKEKTVRKCLLLLLPRDEFATSATR